VNSPQETPGGEQTIKKREPGTQTPLQAAGCR
jgi:hypothetical protein